MRNEIIEVWGKADALSLTYSRDKDGLWKAEVPPDLKDGCYAAEIWARNICGETGYWSGFLYMHNGRAKLYLLPKRYSLWMIPNDSPLTLNIPTEIHLERSCRYAQSDF